MSSNWSKISLSNPVSIENNVIKGDGWQLELTDDYILSRDESNNNYKLIKNKIR